MIVEFLQDDVNMASYRILVLVHTYIDLPVTRHIDLQSYLEGQSEQTKQTFKTS